ncbi:MAG: hypothetical protein GDA41_06460 [Rhodospirillales bacterium]|nr:hypothetical protein [Rhodospirillales bacterium]
MNVEAAHRANLAHKYGDYRKDGLKHGQALARAQADYTPVFFARLLKRR